MKRSQIYRMYRRKGGYVNRSYLAMREFVSDRKIRGKERDNERERKKTVSSRIDKQQNLDGDPDRGATRFKIFSDMRVYWNCITGVRLLIAPEISVSDNGAFDNYHGSLLFINYRPARRSYFALFSLRAAGSRIINRGTPGVIFGSVLKRAYIPMRDSY